MVKPVVAYSYQQSVLKEEVRTHFRESVLQSGGPLKLHTRKSVWYACCVVPAIPSLCATGA